MIKYVKVFNKKRKYNILADRNIKMKSVMTLLFLLFPKKEILKLVI